ncbi:MAG: hypothetical protein HYT08_01255 [Candidatus Levybacteria bacterium]|nr:hypothetical protein [Candidatus Levybacteria bacterium]
MRIGIDISQLAYPSKTGVYNYLSNLLLNLTAIDKENYYILFFSSLRRSLPIPFENKVRLNKKVTIKKFKFPPTLLDILWNKLHVLSIDKLIDDIDIFMTSDWTEPPLRNGKKTTIIYDLTIYKASNEMDKKIINTQKRKFELVKKESDMIFCISDSTKKDVMDILEIPEKKIKVIYPGI